MRHCGAVPPVSRLPQALRSEAGYSPAVRVRACVLHHIIRQQRLEGLGILVEKCICNQRMSPGWQGFRSQAEGRCNCSGVQAAGGRRTPHVAPPPRATTAPPALRQPAQGVPSHLASTSSICCSRSDWPPLVLASTRFDISFRLFAVQVTMLA